MFNDKDNKYTASQIYKCKFISYSHPFKDFIFKLSRKLIEFDPAKNKLFQSSDSASKQIMFEEHELKAMEMLDIAAEMVKNEKYKEEYDKADHPTIKHNIELDCCKEAFERILNEKPEMAPKSPRMKP